MSLLEERIKRSGRKPVKPVPEVTTVPISPQKEHVSPQKPRSPYTESHSSPNAAVQDEDLDEDDEEEDNLPAVA